ncbi:MAG: cytochrome C oxidase subunit IV family protein [Planctomycetes bacterium]|nr:cytochrome C oxidase subunit IV family protein [Planctomycetota bacterium]
MSTTTAPTHDHEAAHDHGHAVPLWGLFLALLALTAGEVALFEIWHQTQQHNAAGEVTWQLMPKFAMVLLLLVFTLPKAAIVLIFFMHLKFEKQFIVLLALIPFVFATIAVLPTLTDITTLLHHGQTYNGVPHEQLGGFNPHGASHGEGHGGAPTEAHEPPATAPAGAETPAH